MIRSFSSSFVAVVVAAAASLSLFGCSRDEVANRKAPSSVEGAAVAAPTPAAVAPPVAPARPTPLAFGAKCAADADCATGACFRKGASAAGGSDNGEGSGGGNGGGGTSAGHAVAPRAAGEVVVGYCSMPCNGNNDCPTPLTGGKCNGRGFCKKD